MLSGTSSSSAAGLQVEGQRTFSSQERKEDDTLLNGFSMGPAGSWLALVTFELSLGNSRDP